MSSFVSLFVIALVDLTIPASQLAPGAHVCISSSGITAGHYSPSPLGFSCKFCSFCFCRRHFIHHLPSSETSIFSIPLLLFESTQEGYPKSDELGSTPTVSWTTFSCVYVKYSQVERPRNYSSAFDGCLHHFLFSIPRMWMPTRCFCDV